jgi:glucose-6-phosphate isomerase
MLLMGNDLLSNTRVDVFAVDPGPLAEAYAAACGELERLGFVDALWRRSLDVWPADPDARRSIANRLGWLGAVDFITPHVPTLAGFGTSVRDGGFTDVVLLGMGGSSLAPEVLRQVLGVAAGFPRFRMLDSVDPEAVRGAFDRPATTLFILASKSGSTIEPNALAAEARRRLAGAGYGDAGPRFVTITDEGTPLHKRALTERFRDVFVNPPDVGGRYSALTYFGMVPAATMGADLERLVIHARRMDAACRERSVTANPGVALGALLAAGARNGRDKLTLVLPPRLQSFGLWVEQLVAESTGKRGVGLVPVTGEPPHASLGDDRVAVVLQTNADRVDAAVIGRLREAALPVAMLEIPEAAAIAAEFLRWEVATATAGALMGINPFDEPNVQQAKDATRALLERYADGQNLPKPEPHASSGGAVLTASRAAVEALNGEPATSFLQLIRRGDYFALLPYLPPDDDRFAGTLQDLRGEVSRRTGSATTLGYGPRYLHSTGQLHKGGPNAGVFVMLTAEPETDLAVPDAPYTFGVLETAQAIGDFQSLDAAGRRALYVHLPERNPALLQHVASMLLSAL